MAFTTIVWLAFSAQCLAGLLYIFRPDFVEIVIGSLTEKVLIQQIGIATLGLGGLAFSLRGAKDSFRKSAIATILALHLVILAFQGYFHFAKHMTIPPTALGVTAGTAVLLLLSYFGVVPSQLTLLLFGGAWSARSVFFLVKPEVVMAHIFGLEFGPTREILFYPLGLVLLFTGLVAFQLFGLPAGDLRNVCGSMGIVNLLQAAAVFATTPVYDVPFAVKAGTGVLLLLAYLVSGSGSSAAKGAKAGKKSN